MNDTAITGAPFGTCITSEDVLDTLTFFDAWEDRYRYLIDLGKELQPMDEAKKDEAHRVHGCQSQVWIDTHREGNKLYFSVDSDAFIVKGLLGVVLAAYNGKTSDEVLAFDIDGYFEQLDLISHLSSTRGNGLRAMVKRILDEAERI